MAERETETAADSISDSIFNVTNMFGVNFLNSKGKPVAITDPSHRPDYIIYLNLRTNTNPHLI